ncbi:MAG: peptidoglycan-binding domain-containing protein [Cardiobacteriaceae bacterium]|nr:peptidoglycan-binding domain-containing protein [Cardiobacteriaceae bacterium]
MMKRKSLVLLSSMAIAAWVHAQEATATDAAEAPAEDAAAAPAETTPPANAIALSIPQVASGECQALVVVPAKFEPRTEQVVIKEASETIELVPAEYEWVEQQIEVKPAGKELKVIPATYKTVEEEIEIEPASVEREVIEPQFKEVSEDVVSKPAYLSAHNEGGSHVFSSMGEALRLAEVPAETKTITKQVVSDEASVKETTVDAKFQTIQKQVIDEEARIEEVEVEAVYETVRVKKLVKEAEEKRIEVPAEYAEVTVYDKVADAQMRWEPVMCGGNDAQTTAKIEDIQRALNEAGYQVGKVDGQMGPGTKRALEKFQRDKGLAVGGVTQETLSALGL